MCSKGISTSRSCKSSMWSLCLYCKCFKPLGDFAVSFKGAFHCRCLCCRKTQIYLKLELHDQRKPRKKGLGCSLLGFETGNKMASVLQPQSTRRYVPEHTRGEKRVMSRILTHIWSELAGLIWVFSVRPFSQHRKQYGVHFLFIDKVSLSHLYYFTNKLITLPQTHDTGGSWYSSILFGSWASRQKSNVAAMCVVCHCNSIWWIVKGNRIQTHWTDCSRDGSLQAHYSCYL